MGVADPTSLAPARLTDGEVAADVTAALDLGLDALRVEGHIAHPALYAEADERGLLLLQDFPLQWGHARSVRRQAVEQARAAGLPPGLEAMIDVIFIGSMLFSLAINAFIVYALSRQDVKVHFRSNF